MPQDLAQAPRQNHVRLQLGQFLAGDRRQVDRVDRFAGLQVDGDLSRDLQAGRGLCLRGGRAQMRCKHDITQFKQGRITGRFLDEDVQRRAGKAPRLQRVVQRRLVHQAAAGTVDQARSFFHLCDARGIQQAAGLVVDGAMQGHVIRTGQQFIQ